MPVEEGKRSNNAKPKVRVRRDGFKNSETKPTAPVRVRTHTKLGRVRRVGGCALSCRH